MNSTISKRIETRSDELLKQQFDDNTRATNKLFSGLLIFQWIAGTIIALVLSPYTWQGADFHLHPLVIQAFVLGFLNVILPIYLIKMHPTAVITRHVVAVAQMLTSSLLIHISGGRIETHFHIFGSLAFLAFYRDWRVLVTASLVVLADHLLRGALLPESIFGVLNAGPFRPLEHAAWVVFEDVFLIGVCVRMTREMRSNTRQRAELEMQNEVIESRVEEKIEALRVNELRMQMLLDTATDSIFGLSHEGKILSANASAEAAMKYRSGDLKERKIGEVVNLQKGNGDLIDFAEFKSLYFANIADVKRETTVRAADGSVLTVELSLGKMEHAAEQNYTLILRDISSRKMAERRVAEFYSTISHELRSPLTSIRGALGLIENGGFGEIPTDALELITIASSSTKRLIRLINDILDLRKIEEGKMQLASGSCSARDVMELAVDAVRGMAEEAHVHVDSIVPDHLYMTGDQDRLTQVLINLLANAIKFTNAEDRIKVIAAPASGSTVRFTVTDHGPGIKEADFAKLFGKFQQLDSSDTRNTEGTGLGLAICKALVEQQGGKIGFTSFVGHGSTFWFEMPLVKRQMSDQLTVVAKTKDRSVLLVEDDEDLSRVLQVLLTRSGYECLHASTIADAERILAESLPSAAIIDLRLPDGSGLNLIDRLQKDLKTSSVPVVVMTGSDEVSLGNRKTIIEWLHKPFEDEQLLNAVKKAVSGAKPSTVLIVDDDASTRSVIARQISSLGVVCVEASDGAEAIAMARKHNPDLIVLDVLMPRPDGFEVVDILRQQGIENTRLIVYTAKDLSEQDKRALTLGMTKYISKASRSDTEFLGAVKELLGSSFNPPPTLSG